MQNQKAGTQLGFLLGPSVIDSSFQALMALADPDVGIGSLKIPLSIKRPLSLSPETFTKVSSLFEISRKLQLSHFFHKFSHVSRLQPTGRSFSIGVWSHFQLLDWTEHSTVFRHIGLRSLWVVVTEFVSTLGALGLATTCQIVKDVRSITICQLSMMGQEWDNNCGFCRSSWPKANFLSILAPYLA